MKTTAARSASAPPRADHHIRRLQAEFQAAGVYAPATRYHAVWLAAFVAIYAASYSTLLSNPGLAVRVVAVVAAAIALMQSALFAHEVGHGGVTKSIPLRNALGHFNYGFLAGFSFSYWQSTHSKHHNHPNKDGIDPDLDSIAYALHESAAKRSHGAGRMVARMQPLSALLGFLFWAAAIKTDGVIYVARHFSRRTVIDTLAILAHVGVWLVIPTMVLGWRAAFLNYAAITLLNGVYMAGILVVPHVGAGTEGDDDDLSFFERQVRFSRNYNASWFGTLLCGGLNLQIEHHLLPHVPCVRLRRARPAILAYCQAHDLPYRQTRYWSAWAEVLAYLRRMGEIAAANDGGELRVVPLEKEAS